MSSLSLSLSLSLSVSDALARAAAHEPMLQAWAHLASPASLVNRGAAGVLVPGADIECADPAAAFLADSAAPKAESDLSEWPIGVKDIIDVAGMPTRCGSAACDDLPASFDATCVALLRAAGCVPIGKTVTTEFAYVTPGPTRNPANLAHTPGGSSSGSAAVVAASQVRLALGTQTGGSMIRPAAFCGVVGFKPTHGVVPRGGMVVACESLDVIGWYTRDVDDAAAAGRVLLPSIADRHEQSADRSSVLAQCRIGFLAGHPGHDLDDEASMTLDAALSMLHNAGLHSSPVLHDAFPVQQLLAAHHTLMHYEFARSLLPVVQRHGDRLSQRLREAVTRGLGMPGDRYTAARRFQADARLCWGAWFGDADLILASSVLGPAPKGLAHTGDSGFNKGWSVLGWPCIHLPTGYSRDGLPLGVMLVGPPGADHALLAYAAALHPLIDTRPALSSPRLDPLLEHLA